MATSFSTAASWISARGASAVPQGTPDRLLGGGGIAEVDGQRQDLGRPAPAVPSLPWSFSACTSNRARRFQALASSLAISPPRPFGRPGEEHDAIVRRCHAFLSLRSFVRRRPGHQTPCRAGPGADGEDLG